MLRNNQEVVARVLTKEEDTIRYTNDSILSFA